MNEKLSVATLLIMLFFSLAACKGNVAIPDNAEQEMSSYGSKAEEISTNKRNKVTINEIESCQFDKKPSQLAVLGVFDPDLDRTELCPCVLVDGTAYLYRDGKWNEIWPDKKFTQIYSDEYFCAITTDGEIFAVSEGLEAYKTESMPLGSAGVFYNADKVLELTAGKKVKQLSGTIFRQESMVLFSDGKTELFFHGTGHRVADSVNVEEISGDFLRTDSGDVYHLKSDFYGKTLEIQKISSDIKSICSSYEKGCYIGIKSDGSLDLWRPEYNLKLLKDLSDFQNIESVSMGFSYFVALGKDGKVRFSHYGIDDNDDEEMINSYMDKMTKRAIHIACVYERIVIMYYDYSMSIIDFERTSTS